MKIFNGIIQKTTDLLTDFVPRKYLFNPRNLAAQGEKNELILMSEAAFELGENSLPSVSYALITENEELVSGDGVLLYGKDLQELKENSPFARITILLTDNIEEHGDKGAYTIIKNIEMKKYDVSPAGYMMRVSGFSNREQVRVSKAAIKSGLSFESVGNLFISKYKENFHVRAAKVIFVTLPEAPYAELERLATDSAEITRALDQILADIKMDCRACDWKPVCDEVEGMKDMHLKLSEH